MRIDEILVESKQLDAGEQSQYDNEWNTNVTLVLVPHPTLKHPKAIELDYQMHNQKLELTLRVAEAKYLLRHWNVDVTEEGTMGSYLHHLWLKNSNDIASNHQTERALSLTGSITRGGQ
jgi:hypothetical protein